MSLKVLKRYKFTTDLLRLCKKLYIHSSLHFEDTNKNALYHNISEINNNNKYVNKDTIFKYLKSINATQTIKITPKHPLLKKRKLSSLYLVDKNNAEKFASMLINDLLENKSETMIVETNPGFGFLTKQLLNKGVPVINLFESESTFLVKQGPLDNLSKKYPYRLVINHINFLSLWKLNYDEKFQRSFINNRPVRKWEEKPTMIIIATISDIGFITNVIHSIVYKSFFIEYGRSRMYLALLPSIWAKLTSTKNVRTLYRWRTVLFQVLFNFNHIGILDRKSFLPWIINKKYMNSHIYKDLQKLDNTSMYIVKIEPKADLFAMYFNNDELILFWHFVRNNIASRTSKVIPELEKWAPGCGVKIIQLGYNIFTEFGDLSPQEILNVFQVFIASQNFDKNIFLSHMENQAKEIENEDQSETLIEV